MGGQSNARWGHEMLVMAIDPNTKTGVTEGHPGKTPIIATHNFRRDETDTIDDIFRRATFFFADRLRDDPPEIAFIEAPVPPMGVAGATTFNTTLITLGIYAIVSGIFGCKKIELRRAPINTWRKYALASGRLRGDEAKRRAVRLCRALNWSAEDHNGAESACIWLYGTAQVAPHLAVRPEPLFTGATA